jgi:hypothetical protein
VRYIKGGFAVLLLLFIDVCSAQSENKSVTQLFCDSIYPNKSYKIIMQVFPDGLDSTNENNLIFQTLLTSNDNAVIFFTDTVFSHNGKLSFHDFNNDGIRDILIEENSDVRSNTTYNLYLVDTAKNKLKKVNGFHEIRNPVYLHQYNLIESYVVSGEDYTQFYQIGNDTIKQYDITVSDDHKENGSYEKEYEKAIQQILKREKQLNKL